MDQLDHGVLLARAVRVWPDSQRQWDGVDVGVFERRGGSARWEEGVDHPEECEGWEELGCSLRVAYIAAGAVCRIGAGLAGGLRGGPFHGGDLGEEGLCEWGARGWALGLVGFAVELVG